MRIAIDYDHTITADPVLFNRMVCLMLQSGHEVKIVTFRENITEILELNQEVFDFAETSGIGIIFTAGRQKKGVCQTLGWIPDIWIDDQPEYIPNYNELAEVTEACNLIGDW